MRRWAGSGPPVEYLTGRSGAVPLLRVFHVFFCLVFAVPLCASVCVCLVVACWGGGGGGLASWLSFVVSGCEFVTFPLVLWVRCGT